MNIDSFKKTELELILLYLFKLKRHDIEAVMPDVVVDETVDALLKLDELLQADANDAYDNLRDDLA